MEYLSEMEKEIKEMIEEGFEDLLKGTFKFGNVYNYLSSGDIIFSDVRMRLGKTVSIRFKFKQMVYGIVIYKDKPYIFMKFQGKASFYIDGQSIRGKMTGFGLNDIENMGHGINKLSAYFNTNMGKFELTTECRTRLEEDE